jgi:hypothetical protein
MTENGQKVRRELGGNAVKVVAMDNQLERPPQSRQTQADANRMDANRLAALCRQSRSRNFQETVLEGVPLEVRALTLEAFRRFTQNTHALLGHEGRNYEGRTEETEGAKNDGGRDSATSVTSPATPGDAATTGQTREEAFQEDAQTEEAPTGGETDPTTLETPGVTAHMGEPRPLGPEPSGPGTQ